MADYSPTIIAASLNDNELKNAINSLVQYVDAGTKKMSESMTNAVAEMKRQLASLGNINVDMGGADGGSSRRTRKQTEETQAVKETTVAYDQLAQAQQKATGVKSARDSYYAFVQGYKEQANQISQQIREAEAALNKAIENRVAELNNKLANAKTKLNELNVELARQRMEAERTGNYSNYNAGISRTTQAIEYQMRHIAELQKQISEAPNMFGTQVQGINALKSEHERVLNIMKEETTSQQRATSVTQQQTQEAQKYTAEIQKQANEIRNSQQFKEKGWYGVTLDKEANHIAFVEAQSKLSIEEQLVAIYGQQSRAKESQTEQNTNQNRQVREQLEVEQQITQEYQKRQSAQANKQIDFNTKLASTLGLNPNEVVAASTGKINQLTSELKQYETAYARLTKSERESPFGLKLREEIQKTSRVLQQYRAEMLRPISLTAIDKLSTKTLDDIAYKIQMLQRYRSGLDINSQSLEIRGVNTRMAELSKLQNDILEKNKSLLTSNNALARSWNYMKNRLAFYFTVGASTMFVKNLIDVRSQYELLERSMGILFDSMQTGTKIFAELNAMALKSPFTTMELGSAAKQLSAYNIAAKDVVDTTRRLADMAAAVGIPIERLTYALGQIKSYGYLNSRDQRMFANAGIPLVQSLADMYSKLEGRLVSMGDVYDRIKKKQVSFEDTMKVINEMTDKGGRFFNFQEKSADTLKVKLANLTLAWNNMLNEIGKDGTGMINSALSGAKMLFDNWRKINNIILSIIATFGTYKAIQVAMLVLSKERASILAWENILGRKLVATFISLKSTLATLAFNPMTWVTALVSSVMYLWIKWRDLNSAVQEFNRTISNNAKENIESIGKFYEQYGKDIENASSLQVADQQRLWEKVREEIEKTSKNARNYLEILESSGDVVDRIYGGQKILDQINIIEKEAKRLADGGYFSLGGGFFADDMAESLKDYDNVVKQVIEKFDNLNDATKYFREHNEGWISTSEIYEGYIEAEKFVDFTTRAQTQISEFISVLDKADLSRIMGGGDAKTQLANIREFAQIIRDNFLATERGQKVGIEGQAKLNAAIDNWVTLQGKANNLLSDEQVAIELHRSAWEKFFDTLNEEEKKRADYLIRTNQLGSDEFKKIWDNAAEYLKKSSETSYQQIQEQIADLRGTAPIVIDVIYRERREQKDAQQERFEADLITPKYIDGNGKVVTAEEYFAEEAKLRAKYGRFNKKEGEDNVDWEKRLGEEYQSNAKKIESLNNQLKNSASLTEEDKNAKENERDALVGINDVLKQIEKREGFDYDQFEKGKKSGGGSKKDPLGDALTKELQLIQDIQKLYKEYTKAGVDSETAKNAAAKEYQKTLEQTNATLSKFGIKGLTGEQIATMDLRTMRDTYQSILDKVQSSPKAVEALEKAIRNLNVEITKEGQKTLIDSLNNELGKLKDEYELAVELDANPELGGVFADMMGLSKEELEKLPRDFEGVVKKLQNIVDKEMGMGAFDVRSNLNKDVFDEWVKSNKYSQDSDLVAKLKALTEYANKVRLDETKKQIEDWNKLLEKYAEYEYKRNQILQTYERERETALKKGATQEVLDAITREKDQKLAGLNFEQFQKSSTWLTATGDLATLTDSALGLLIKRLEEYKKSAKNLDPKQIKQINNALKSLRREQRQGNPFLAIANAKDAAKETWDTYQDEIDEYMEKLKKLNDLEEKNGELTLEQENTRNDLISTIAKLRKEQEETGKVSATTIVEGLQGMLSTINQVTSSIGEMFSAFGNTEASENIQKVTQVLDKAASFAAMGAQIGGGWGAVIGGVVGGLMGAMTAWADEISGNAAITRKIEESERAVKRLSNVYEELSWQADNAYGVIVSGAQRATVENKKLQLAEAERQLELEKSRSKKRYDEERVIDLQGQVESLRREIKDATSEIVNELLGISSAGDEITNLVQVMIDAFRNGEDAMEAFGKEWDKMIDNMILKLIVSEYMKRSWDDIMKTIEDKQEEFLREGTKAREDANAEIERLRTQNGYDLAKEYVLQHYKETGGDLFGLDKHYFALDVYNRDQLAKAAGFANAEALRQYLIEQQQGIMSGADAQLERASQDYTEWTLDYMMHEGRDIMMSAAEGLKEGLDQYYDFGELAEGQKLSNLQQGIQGITEDTAGALEAMLNGISQQVYLHSDILIEIRDVLQSFDFDVRTGVQAQILLELQTGFQTVNAMRTLMENWTTPAGNGIRVEIL